MAVPAWNTLEKRQQLMVLVGAPALVVLLLWGVALPAFGSSRLPGRAPARRVRS